MLQVATISQQRIGDPDLLRGVYAMGFKAPSKIQATTLPMLLADPLMNIIAQSQTGTGKTAACVLAALSRVDTGAVFNTHKFKVFDVKKISVFVLDEADVMIATDGHQDYCIRLHKQLSNNCQMMFLSATYDQEVMEFAELIVQNPTIIPLERVEESLDNIRQ